MLKLTVHPGEYIQIGDNIKVVFAGGSGNNIHVLVDAPREVGIVRSTLLEERDSYYVDEKLPEEAVREIKRIIMKNKNANRGKNPSAKPKQGQRNGQPNAQRNTQSRTANK